MRLGCVPVATERLGGLALNPIVQTIFPQLAVERRPADPQRTGDARHAPAIVLEGERDEVALEIGQGGDFAAGIDEAIGYCLYLFNFTKTDAKLVNMNGC